MASNFRSKPQTVLTRRPCRLPPKRIVLASWPRRSVVHDSSRYLVPESGRAQYARCRGLRPAAIEKSRNRAGENVVTPSWLCERSLHIQGPFGALAPLRIVRRNSMNCIRQIAAAFLVSITSSGLAGADPSDPDLIFRKSTTFKLLTPNDKLAVYGVDDPLVDGVACHYTAPQKGRTLGRSGVGRTDIGHFSVLSAIRSNQVQGNFHPGRCRLQRAPFTDIQENANRARMRYKTKYPRLHDL